ncbi:MBL fold metallo-hydrolase [Candidatus Kapabacteria bacterium]|nr:MBL fold metallo-hydrolase [Candidatus Kapabacteria bacterium]
MKIGKYKLKVVETSNFALDGGAMFGVVPKPLWTKAYSEPDEKNRIPLTARLMLIDTDQKKILIDTGMGDKFDEKFEKIYNVRRSETPVALGLAKHNLKCEDITDVILTHLHFDHVGGATQFVNGEIQPTFKNAKYYVQKQQYEWALNPTLKDRASFINHNYVPLKEDGLLELIDGEGEIFPGIKLLPIDGHTKAMQMVKISDDDNTLLYITDLCPTHAHIIAPYHMGYDNFPLTVLEEKEKYLPQAYEDNWTIFFEHDHKVEAAKITSAKKGFIVSDTFKI